MRMTKKDALEIVGGLSKPGKMPCPAWGIPPEDCKTGSVLALEVPDSVCARCYARKGRGVMPNVRGARARRLAAWRDAGGAWVAAMARLVGAGQSGYFRRFDSGDLQGDALLADIADVAAATPGVFHWLPTMEADIARRWAHRLPGNLCVRVTSPRVDMLRGAIGRLPRSVVVSSADKLPTVAPGAWACPATFDHDRKTCGPCRACWDPKVMVVAYLEH